MTRKLELQENQAAVVFGDTHAQFMMPEKIGDMTDGGSMLLLAMMEVATRATEPGNLHFLKGLADAYYARTIKERVH